MLSFQTDFQFLRVKSHSYYFLCNYQGRHELVYATQTPEESFEWVNLREVSVIGKIINLYPIQIFLGFDSDVVLESYNEVKCVILIAGSLL